jgi:hypothetical protein
MGLKYKKKKEIFFTTDYSQFELLPTGNRKIEMAHVNKLRESLKLTGGNIQAIIVIWYQGHFYIVEGQHRFRASQLEKLPLKVEVVEKVEGLSVREFIIQLNVNSKNWRPETHFRTRAEEVGGPVYSYWVDLLNKERNWTLVRVMMRLTDTEVREDVMPRMYPDVNTQVELVNLINETHKKVTKVNTGTAVSIRTEKFAKALIGVNTVYQGRRARGENLPLKLDYKKIGKSFKNVMPPEGMPDNRTIIGTKLSEALDFGKSDQNKIYLLGGKI